jgi:hypothetical protein
MRFGLPCSYRVLPLLLGISHCFLAVWQVSEAFSATVQLCTTITSHILRSVVPQGQGYDLGGTEQSSTNCSYLTFQPQQESASEID